MYLITWKTDKAENKQTNVLIFYTSWTLGAPELLSGITLGSDHQLVCCAMPWAVSSSLDDDKLFLDPSTTSMLSSWFYLIWYYYLSVKFVMWIVKQKIENKWNVTKIKLYFNVSESSFSDINNNIDDFRCLPAYLYSFLLIAPFSTFTRNILCWRNRLCFCVSFLNWNHT